MVYLARALDESLHPTGPVKIGKANDPYSRRLKLKGPNGFPLVVEAIAPGAFTEEHWLHARFARFRIEGHREYFEPAPPILRLIDELNYHKPGTFSLLTLLDVADPR